MNENSKSAWKRTAIRAWGILLQPAATLSVVASEAGGLKDTFIPYAVILAAIPPVVILIGGTVLAMVRTGYTGRIVNDVSIAIINIAATWYFSSLLLTLVMGKFMDWLAPLFGAKKSWVLSCRILIYAATPLYLAGFFGIIPVFGISLLLLFLPWTLVLLYMGIGQVLGAKGISQLFFTLTVCVISWLLLILSMSSVPFFISKATR